MPREWRRPLAEFDPAAFHRALLTVDVGRFMVFREVIDSTMVVARRELDEGAPHGTLVMAEEQTAGRGRKGRTFQSPRGENLYFTLLLRSPLDTHRRLPVLVPLAVCRAVTGLGVQAAIKWPNDLWAGGRKLCGMLIDAELAQGQGFAMVGIGVNVNGDPTIIPELADIATSVRRELGRDVSREALLAAICNELEVALQLAPAEAIARYRAASLVLGREVVVTPLSGLPFVARAESIAQDGSLVVLDSTGQRRSLNAAEVTLRPASEAGSRPA
ncbi:MAG: biotin--[acetyl-CoA-carboxylase] ligase [Tepidiformaceae bacterium]